MKIRVLIVGCGNMGTSHALAYHNIEEFEICGLVSTGESKVVLNNKLGGKYQLFSSYDDALEETLPDAVCISTYPDTHEEYAIKAMECGCHVFLEKPVADSISGAENVVQFAKAHNKKLVIGYILRHHPSWIKFVDIAKTLGRPLVMRMNLNQQSSGKNWETHQNIMKSLSPIVDCGVHYIDVMCQITRSKPISVHAIGARLTEDIPQWNYNYGQLQIKFEDGSIGWYEAGWGPMMSQTAFFVKDIIGPDGSVSIVAQKAENEGKSDSVAAHTATESLRIHHSNLNANKEFDLADEWVNLEDEPNHNELCEREQRFFLKAIIENVDLTEHNQDAINSLRIAFACDESIRENQVVKF
ncbi:oxidoreductase domain protein [Pseudopedobacter saltans DSM 12145]|uniref:Oxidoreductase domain protein n=1 Tax=Pseudopedobacter saltans (strain ATCC 51119 / DSM 12145 / JCM 21818 / CCUG 39354 / LMG 10337 / NBRC 100064 / NCIMB 13643) TaxID=762903 RepID=F0S8I1_PSESL|nr:Gfo/Idh/MocA family oxidoreductase [Pseudopedobacter saltans]ADY51265.1 oxidoreductase domain protein [Pseudopedobacter saltans DSM 12145]